MDTPSPADVLRVWFGNDDPQGIVAPQMDRWFKTDVDFDTRLRERFGTVIEAGIRGELALWEDTPGGALALVILLDQFSRNAYRGDARSFAADPAALAAAERAVSRGFNRAVAWLARSFLYLPWEHAESLAHQDRALALFRTLATKAPDGFGSLGASFVEYAEKHRAVIARFGRFPHRNADLGRESTPDELAFLTTGRGF